MKLLTRTGIYYLTITLILFLIGGIVFYFSLNNIINQSITERMYEVKKDVISYVEKKSTLPPVSPVDVYKVIFTESNLPVKESLRDTLRPDEDEQELQPWRVLTFSIKANEKNYSASISRPLVESDDLIVTIAYSFGILTTILLVVLFVLNWFLSKKMWNPFYNTLDELKKFDLNKKEVVYLPAVTISEFKILNEEIQKMTDKIRFDYQNLKEFTENASREIHTPLAIIHSKLELLIQSENLSQEQMKFIQEIYESSNRLSKLNQSLLLLAKIENRQFEQEQSVDFKKIIEKKLQQFEEMLAYKKIKVERNFGAVPEVIMNSHLADILLSNLISNAIRHNNNEGKIIIRLNSNSLQISNTGTESGIAPEKNFERFQKSNSSVDSIGLGLSIVKQICETYLFNVNYFFKDGIHTISISF